MLVKFFYRDNRYSNKNFCNRARKKNVTFVILKYIFKSNIYLNDIKNNIFIYNYKFNIS